MASHRASNSGPPVNTITRPRPTSTSPKPEPMAEVTRVAQRRLPFHFHRAERSTRPPSRGKAGIMLKRIRMPLIQPTASATTFTAGGRPATWPAPPRPRKAAHSNRLTTGPAIATRNSARGVGGSSVISATPPNRNRVMPRIGTSWRRAIRAWPSSWSTMEAKKRRAPITPMIQ